MFTGSGSDYYLFRLTHNVHGAHEAPFWALLNTLQREYAQVRASGYEGEEFYFPGGQRLGSGGYRLGESALGELRRRAILRSGAGQLPSRPTVGWNQVLGLEGGRVLGAVPGQGPVIPVRQVSDALVPTGQFPVTPPRPIPGAPPRPNPVIPAIANRGRGYIPVLIRERPGDLVSRTDRERIAAAAEQRARDAGGCINGHDADKQMQQFFERGVRNGLHERGDFASENEMEAIMIVIQRMEKAEQREAHQKAQREWDARLAGRNPGQREVIIISDDENDQLYPSPPPRRPNRPLPPGTAGISQNPRPPQPVMTGAPPALGWQGGSTWQCGLCTLINDMADVECLACGGESPMVRA